MFQGLWGSHIVRKKQHLNTSREVIKFLCVMSAKFGVKWINFIVHLLIGTLLNTIF